MQVRIEKLRSSIHDSIIFFVIRAGRLKSIISQTRPFALRSAQFTQYLGLDKPKRERAKHSRVARELQVVSNNIAMSIRHLYFTRQPLSKYSASPNTTNLYHLTTLIRRIPQHDIARHANDPLDRPRVLIDWMLEADNIANHNASSFPIALAQQQPVSGRGNCRKHRNALCLAESEEVFAENVPGESALYGEDDVSDYPVDFWVASQDWRSWVDDRIGDLRFHARLDGRFGRGMADGWT